MRKVTLLMVSLSALIFSCDVRSQSNEIPNYTIVAEPVKPVSLSEKITETPIEKESSEPMDVVKFANDPEQDRLYPLRIEIREAIKKQDIERLKKILEENNNDYFGAKNILAIAISLNDRIMIRELLRLEFPRYKITDDHDFTHDSVLEECIMNDDIEMISFLFDNGYRFDSHLEERSKGYVSGRKEGDLILYYRSVNILKYYLDKGYNFNYSNDDKRIFATKFHESSRSEAVIHWLAGIKEIYFIKILLPNLNASKYFIKYEYYYNEIDQSVYVDMETAYDIAKDGGNPEIVGLFEEYGHKSLKAILEDPLIKNGMKLVNNLYIGLIGGEKYYYIPINYISGAKTVDGVFIDGEGNISYLAKNF